MTITKIYENGLAEELGLTVGDEIVEIDGTKPLDIIDVSFLLATDEVEMLVKHPDGEWEVIAFDKDIDEELGVEFSAAVQDGIRQCANACRFCFVAQSPPNMRSTVNIRDDDYRLSFLYGNFITMTNMTEADFARIARLHLSPLYISVQAANVSLRCELLGSKRAAELPVQLDRLAADGISYHTQVVLCEGLNDGDELDRTITELAARREAALSLAVVPVGLTRFRHDNLAPWDADGAAKIIGQVRPWQQKFRTETGRAFVYLSDEFYLLAGEELPPAEEYDGFPQLDNGIGLARNFMDEYRRAAKEPAGIPAIEDDIRLDVICGTLIAPLLQGLIREAAEITPRIKIRLLPVRNDFFGTTVTVSGLLTGEDILAALRLAQPSDGVLLPMSALRSGEDVFLDGLTLRDLEGAFPGVRMETAADGRDFFRAVTAWPRYHSNRQKAAYTWQSNAAYTK